MTSYRGDLPCPNAYNLSQLLTQTAANYPERTAIVFGETRISYAQLDAASNQVANLLVSRGIEPGDKVALSCPNLYKYPSIVEFVDSLPLTATGKILKRELT